MMRRRPENVLVVAAHPDDEVLGCGGTIARLAAMGSTVRIALMADGVGSRHPRGGSAKLKADIVRRRNAARKACQLLGARSVEFGEFPDNRLDAVDRLDLVQAVEALIARHVPDTVLTHHGGDLNVDHRRVHEAVLTAARPQPGHCVQALLFFEIPSSTGWQAPGDGTPFLPDCFVEISAHMGAKRAALSAYGTEMRPWPHARSVEAVEHLARWRGASVGVAAAEAFVVGRLLVRESDGSPLSARRRQRRE